MALSKVAIGNRALQKLGATRIASFDEANPRATAVKSAYDQVRDAELRSYVWNFAIARASVAADGNGPVWGDWSRYGKPSDFIRLIRDDETGYAVDWRIEGQYILSTDSAPLEFKYVARIDDPTYYDALFTEAFAAKLAKEICFTVTGSHAKEAECKQDYDDAIAEAKRVGSIEEESPTPPEDEWIVAMR